MSCSDVMIRCMCCTYESLEMFDVLQLHLLLICPHLQVLFSFRSEYFLFLCLYSDSIQSVRVRCSLSCSLQESMLLIVDTLPNSKFYPKCQAPANPTKGSPHSPPHLERLQRFVQACLDQKVADEVVDHFGPPGDASRSGATEQRTVHTTYTDGRTYRVTRPFEKWNTGVLLLLGTKTLRMSGEEVAVFLVNMLHHLVG